MGRRHVEGVPRLDADHRSLQAGPDEGHIAQQIERLVPGQLVREPERSARAPFSQDQCVVQRASAAESRRPNGGDPVLEAERASWSEFIKEHTQGRTPFRRGLPQLWQQSRTRSPGPPAQLHRFEGPVRPFQRVAKVLWPGVRASKVYTRPYRQSLARDSDHMPIAVAHPHEFGEEQIVWRHALRFDSHFEQSVGKRTRASVERGRLRTLDPDLHIVYSQRIECRQKMFDRVDDLTPMRESGAPGRVADVVRHSRDTHAALDEYSSVIRRSGTDDDAAEAAGVQTNAGKDDFAPESLLLRREQGPARKKHRHIAVSYLRERAPSRVRPIRTPNRTSVCSRPESNPGKQSCPRLRQKAPRFPARQKLPD